MNIDVFIQIIYYKVSRLNVFINETINVNNYAQFRINLLRNSIIPASDRMQSKHTWGIS